MGRRVTPVPPTLIHSFIHSAESKTTIFLLIFSLCHLFPIFSQLRKLSLTSSAQNESYGKSQEVDDNSLPRRHSHKDMKMSLSSLSFAGHDSISGTSGGGGGSNSTSKRPSLKLSNSVMGKIKDRTGIPV